MLIEHLCCLSIQLSLMAGFEFTTKYFQCQKCGGNSIFRVCNCYFTLDSLTPIEDLQDFPDQALEFELKMEELLLKEQDEQAFMLAIYHFFNHFFGYGYYLPENMNAQIAEQQIKYLERICIFLQNHAAQIAELRRKKITVHTLQPLQEHVEHIQMVAAALLR